MNLLLATTTRTLSVLSFFVGLTACVFGQQQMVLEDHQIYYTNNALIYDNGGAAGNMANTAFQATVHAPSGYIHLQFSYFDLPTGSSFRIFYGLDTTALVGVYDGTLKPVDLKGKAFTLVYTPGANNEVRRGFEGVVTAYLEDAHEKVTMPESDCINAIPLCGNSTVNTSANQYENTGQVNDDNGSCYSGTGNGGSVWYSFTPQTSGNLDFLISPTGSTDYDYVLWDITNGCANKTQVSCNFSATQGATGLTSGGTTNSQDASGTTTNQLEAVNSTHVYALCINYYGGTNNGFNLTFHNLASTVNIVDNIPPTIVNAYSPNCASATTFTINFSEYIDCNTLQASDFSMPGHTVALTTTNCSGGKTISVVVTISPALTPGNYSLTVNSMTDLCGNPLNQVFPINTLANPTPNAGPDQVACSTPGLFGTTNYGSVTLTGSGGASYAWSTGQTSAAISVSPSATTTYTLTAITGSCALTDQVTVTVSPSPTPNLGPDQTVCAGFPVTLTASGGVSYQWQSTTTTFFGTPTGWTNIAGATSASYTASPGATIYYRVLVTNAAGCTGNDYIKITIGSGTFGITAPPFVCQGNAVTLTLPASMTQYTWNVAGTPIGSANTALNVTPATTTTYTAVSTTPGCTGSANVTVPVHPLSTLTTTANPTTACAGVPVNLTSNAPANTDNSSTETFESANSYTLVNGANNKWYRGTATFAAGSYGLYIGTAATDNNYSIGSAFSPKAATNFAYKDYAVTSFCSPTLAFKWKCNGQSAQAELTVWAVPTSFTPVAGTQITASATNILLGGPYFGSTVYTPVTVSMLPFAGTSVRIVYQWRNTGAALILGPVVANPAASIDDIVFTDVTTYNYSWTSTPAGYSAITANSIANPTSATSYSLTVTRCDGCPVTSSISVTNCTPLPVELTGFGGSNKGAYNDLRWSVASEINNDYFTLERSIDVSEWKQAAIVNGAGTTTEEQFYSYYDFEFTTNKINYYRLIQTDLNGEPRVISNVVSIDNLVNAKTVVKRTNVLGQLVSEQQKGLIILVYEDGSIEKRYLE